MHNGRANSWAREACLHVSPTGVQVAIFLAVYLRSCWTDKKDGPLTSLHRNLTFRKQTGYTGKSYTGTSVSLNTLVSTWLWSRERGKNLWKQCMLAICLQAFLPVFLRSRFAGLASSHDVIKFLSKKRAKASPNGKCLATKHHQTLVGDQTCWNIAHQLREKKWFKLFERMLGDSLQIVWECLMVFWSPNIHRLDLH